MLIGAWYYEILQNLKRTIARIYYADLAQRKRICMHNFNQVLLKESKINVSFRVTHIAEVESNSEVDIRLLLSCGFSACLTL